MFLERRVGRVPDARSINSQFRYRVTNLLLTYVDKNRSSDLSLNTKRPQWDDMTQAQKRRTGTELYRRVNHPCGCDDENDIVEEELGGAPSRRTSLDGGTRRGYVDGETGYAAPTW